ncbi:hypothetical protein M427DRAFT_65946 [Gonapodya prolifera JEL478]|uniref:Uncharacterized protein n=1 Tax=Gonapodya prolifera (strain JEL478) TaxID=1344416 RepID=A0A139AXI5_GONPJ|nr:hypothetical protein M427DRAFT_65946 [Gonapodya prolifera JEL478]|eukprot:KXS21165.1 hypothetical protein M427DRAFT_65946 [Gonapodya prolifera JEL478]
MSTTQPLSANGQQPRKHRIGQRRRSRSGSVSDTITLQTRTRRSSVGSVDADSPADGLGNVERKESRSSDLWWDDLPPVADESNDTLANMQAADVHVDMLRRLDEIERWEMDSDERMKALRERVEKVARMLDESVLMSKKKEGLTNEQPLDRDSVMTVDPLIIEPTAARTDLVSVDRVDADQVSRIEEPTAPATYEVHQPPSKTLPRNIASRADNVDSDAGLARQVLAQAKGQLHPMHTGDMFVSRTSIERVHQDAVVANPSLSLRNIAAEGDMPSFNAVLPSGTRAGGASENLDQAPLRSVDTGYTVVSRRAVERAEQNPVVVGPSLSLQNMTVDTDGITSNGITHTVAVSGEPKEGLSHSIAGKILVSRRSVERVEQNPVMLNLSLSLQNLTTRANTADSSSFVAGAMPGEAKEQSRPVDVTETLVSRISVEEVDRTPGVVESLLVETTTARADRVSSNDVLTRATPEERSGQTRTETTGAPLVSRPSIDRVNQDEAEPPSLVGNVSTWTDRADRITMSSNSTRSRSAPVPEKVQEVFSATSFAGDVTGLRISVDRLAKDPVMVRAPLMQEIVAARAGVGGADAGAGVVSTRTDREGEREEPPPAVHGEDAPDHVISVQQEPLKPPLMHASETTPPTVTQDAASPTIPPSQPPTKPRRLAPASRRLSLPSSLSSISLPTSFGQTSLASRTASLLSLTSGGDVLPHPPSGKPAGKSPKRVRKVGTVGEARGPEGEWRRSAEEVLRLRDRSEVTWAEEGATNTHHAPPVVASRGSFAAGNENRRPSPTQPTERDSSLHPHSPPTPSPHTTTTQQLSVPSSPTRNLFENSGFFALDTSPHVSGGDILAPTSWQSRNSVFEDPDPSSELVMPSSATNAKTVADSEYDTAPASWMSNGEEDRAPLTVGQAAVTVGGPNVHEGHIGTLRGSKTGEIARSVPGHLHDNSSSDRARKAMEQAWEDAAAQGQGQGRPRGDNAGSSPGALTGSARPPGGSGALPRGASVPHVADAGVKVKDEKRHSSLWKLMKLGESGRAARPLSEPGLTPARQSLELKSINEVPIPKRESVSLGPGSKVSPNRGEAETQMLRDTPASSRDENPNEVAGPGSPPTLAPTTLMERDPEQMDKRSRTTTAHSATTSEGVTGSESERSDDTSGSKRKKKKKGFARLISSIGKKMKKLSATP